LAYFVRSFGGNDLTRQKKENAMFTTVSLLGCLRQALQWAHVRMATSPIRLTALQRVVAVDPCRVPVPVPIPIPRRPRAYGLAVALAALATVATIPASSLAQRRSNFELAADGRLVDVQVQVDGIGNAPLYFAPNRFDRRYFQAFKGRNYSLVVRNNTSRRVGVLIAVDGLNVISGERSSLSRHETMYVLDPNERAVIRGWRTSLDHVRRFVFVDEERSYAERTNQSNGDMGWIRVLAFREQRPFWDLHGKIRDRYEEDDEDVPYGAVPELNKRGADSQAAPKPEGIEGLNRAPSETRMQAERDDSNPGTGWGQERRDPVNRTQFTAEASPVDHIVLRYEYARGLHALGIRIWNGRDRLWERERGELGFAQAPKW
jgi:hypothetical protein